MSGDFNTFGSLNEQLLSSLSLEDKKHELRGQQVLHRNVYHSQVYESDDDMMDIDEPSELAELASEAGSMSMIRGDQDGNKEGDFCEVSDDDKQDIIRSERPPTEPSVFPFLSPTMLGARLAVRRPLLLMPPSPKSPKVESAFDSQSSLQTHAKTRKPSVDYEFDISAYQPVSSSNHQLSNRRRELANFDQSTLFPTHQGDSLLDYRLGRVNQVPSTIHHYHHHHHHHFQEGDQPQEDSQLQRYKRKLEQELQMNSQDQELRIHKDRQQQQQQQMAGFENNSLIPLPAPWKSDISPIERIPYILSSYLQLAINLILSLYMVYLIYYVFASIKSDVNHKLYEQRVNLASQIANCRTQYYENKCDDVEYSNLPLMRKKCDQFRKCMNQNPNSIGNLSIINAQIVGMILNSMIEPLSFKFFIFVLWCGFVVFGCNFFFGYVRAKTYYGENNVPDRRY
ncbi:uncharacterized protein LODBEIA_P15450 [Lodderomyces beijingensis]|uniref:Brl1/Brr6 domain-containing protein n=1 Tax=Lodderomyces beijingensis TaxID=1775926 RepID=A0ABP0ZKB9_9ASCO